MIIELNNTYQNKIKKRKRSNNVSRITEKHRIYTKKINSEPQQNKTMAEA